MSNHLFNFCEKVQGDAVLLMALLRSFVACLCCLRGHWRLALKLTADFERLRFQISGLQGDPTPGDTTSQFTNNIAGRNIIDPQSMC